MASDLYHASRGICRRRAIAIVNKEICKDQSSGHVGATSGHLCSSLSMHNDLSYVSTSSGLSSLDKNSNVRFQDHNLSFQDHNLSISAESSSLSNIQPNKLQLKYSQV